MTEGSPKIRPGASYLVEEKKPAIAYRLFRDLLAEPLPGLVITRQHPERVRRDGHLPTTKIIWLSRTPGEANHDPSATGTLLKTVSRFIEENGGEGVVLVDGLEYLIVNNGFLQTLMFIERLNELMIHTKAIALIPVSPDALEDKELALLERNLGNLSKTTVRPVIRFVPKSPEFLNETQRLRAESFADVSCDIDESPKPFEERVREAQARRIPFVVLVSGGELTSGILHVIPWTGRESWMTVEGFLGAIRDWHAES